MLESEDQYELAFTWKIKDFSLCCKNNGEFLSSPVFDFGASELSKWKLLICPNGENITSVGYIGCHLKCQLLKTPNIVIIFKIEISGNDKNILRTLISSNSYTVGMTWGWSHCMSLEFYNKRKTIIDDTLIIACFMKVADKEHNCNAEYLAGGLREKHSFLWKVSNPNSQDWIQSKKFYISEGNFFKITLTCPEDDILVNIQKGDKSPFPIKFVKCKLYVLDTKGNKRNSKRDSHMFDSKQDSWQFPIFITKTHLQYEKNDFLKLGVFRLVCEFSVTYGKVTEDIAGAQGSKFSIKDYYCNIDLALSLQNDFRNLLVCKKYSDIKFKIDEEYFPAHKCVLAARSPVFAAMFDQPMAENQNGIVKLEDIDVNTLKYLMEFMYTDSFEIADLESALRLLIAADKYQVLNLKEKCSAYLIDFMSLENVCETLAIADMINYENLKSCAIDYIKNHSEALLTSSEWCKWIEKNTKLGIEVLREISIYLSAVKK